MTRPMHRYDPSRRLLAYGIAALAGARVDARARSIAAGGYFVSFMSGKHLRGSGSIVGDAREQQRSGADPLITGSGLRRSRGRDSGRARDAKAQVLLVPSRHPPHRAAPAAVGHAIGSKVLLLGGSVSAMGAITATRPARTAKSRSA